MATMDVRMEALVSGNDGGTLGRVWAMLLIKQGHDYLLDHVVVEGGAFERDTRIPFALLARSSGQQIELSVAKHTVLAMGVAEQGAGDLLLGRNDPVFAVDARLGRLRGCYVEETGRISDLLVNEEVAHQLGLISIRAVEEIGPHQVQLGSRISEMGVILQPLQALYQPVELRSEAERFAHSGAGAHPH